MSGGGSESAILYAEVPGFYAAVERVADPALSGRPVIVGGDPRKRGKVQSASPEALAAGVVIGMPMLDALACCPGARRVKTDMKRYREAAGALGLCLRRIVGQLEPIGLGAAYIDASGRRESPEALAGRITQAVDRELGLPLRVGIAPVKFLAKLAAEEAAPEGMRRVRLSEVETFLHPLSLARLPRVGPKTELKLRDLGARTVGELLGLNPSDLELELGNHGLAILELARGRDRSPVRVARHPGSISREVTIAEAGLDRAGLCEPLRKLAHALEMGLERQGLRARRVAIRLRYADQTNHTRSSTLGEPIQTAGEIYAVAEALLDRTEVDSRSVRSLGLTLAGLAPSGAEERQLDLFSPAS